jgi:hypothetical protein
LETIGSKLVEILWLLDPELVVLAELEAVTLVPTPGKLALGADSLLELGAGALLDPEGDVLLELEAGELPVEASLQVPMALAGLGAASCVKGERSTETPGFGKSMMRSPSYTLHVPGRFAAKMDGKLSK